MRFNLIESLRSLFNARAIKKDPFSIVLLDNPSEKLPLLISTVSSIINTLVSAAFLSI
jgi:ABC-type branched-subunit amino acid transport system ATPase component